MSPYLSHLEINDAPKPQTTNTNIRSLLDYKDALSLKLTRETAEPHLCCLSFVQSSHVCSYTAGLILIYPLKT